MTENLRTLAAVRALLCALLFSGQAASMFLPPTYGYPNFGYGNCGSSLLNPECNQLTPTCSCLNEETGPPVDPVSLALALQANKDCIREEKLQFGPNKLPLDARVYCRLNKLFNPLINLEGGLHAFKNQVVELKPCCPRKSQEEEALESYLEDDDIDVDYCNKPVLTYRDVGYVPEKPKCPNFVPGAPSAPLQTTQIIYSGPAPPCLQTKTPPTCTANPFCAYQPGNVFITQNPKCGNCGKCSCQACSLLS